MWINNKKSDLLKRTIFATKIYENILSVSEAVDQGYVMVFDKNGVSMYEQVEVNGEVVLFGKRSRKNNLFYINLDMDTKAQNYAGLHQTIDFPHGSCPGHDLASSIGARQSEAGISRETGSEELA